MRILTSAALALAVLVAPVPMLAVAPAMAIDCPADASEAMKRPGGYCAQISGGGSLSDPASTPDEIDCPEIEPVLLTAGFASQRGARALVAVSDPCEVL